MSKVDTFIVVDEDHSDWKVLREIAKKDHSHPLWENYQSLKLTDYEHVIVHRYNGSPACFHAIQNKGRWPSNVARIASRLYVAPQFRESLLGMYLGIYGLKYVVDNYDKWGYDVLFVSRGVQYGDPHISWKKFHSFVKYATEKTGYSFDADDFLYRCCRKNKQACYQYCYWYDPYKKRHTCNIDKIDKYQWLELPHQA